VVEIWEMRTSALAAMAIFDYSRIRVKHLIAIIFDVSTIATRDWHIGIL
jgi:hypothetical protein